MSDVPAPVSRLSPCPCGSGRRYKDCHGTLTSSPQGAQPAVQIRRSNYRPSGPEWNPLSEPERDELGVSMETALAHQREGRAYEAERQYRDVLARAPKTHDALHMLAMVRLGRGDCAEALRLVEEALSLQAEYPAIRQNLALIRSAQRAQERIAQEAQCEKALPEFFESVRVANRGTATKANTVAVNTGRPCAHLIGVDDGTASDDAWMVRRLAALLGPERAVVWSCRGDAVPAASAGDDERLPADGVHVWVGVDVEAPSWLSRSHPQRTLVFAQSAPPSRWLEMLLVIAGDGVRQPELVVTSRAKAERFGRGHRVLPPPIDLDEFVAGTRDARSRGGEEFTVGNVVQDGRTIMHARANSLQESVASTGMRLDVYDPGRIRHVLGALRNVHCVSRHDLTLAEFLAPLSCYLYSGDLWWMEGLGRDLFGAMAMGIPVLCPRVSIHAEYVRDDIDGVLYDDEAGALEGLAALRNDPARCAAFGASARDHVRRIFDPAVLAAAYRRLVIEE